MKFLTKDEATIEANLLGPYEILYPRAVEAVATALRKRFEAGELRGWVDGDADRYTGRRLDPQTKIENECARRWIKTPVRALGVLATSSNRQGTEADEWVWNSTDLACTLQGAACIAMALDVLQYARKQGWSRPQKGEITPKARRAA